MGFDAAPTQDPMAQSSVLGLLGSRGATSRADLARLLRVSSATVTQICKALIARGLIVETEDLAPSRGGRPARLLELAESAGTAVGVKVTADHVAIVQVELDGEVTSSETVAFGAMRPNSLDELARILEGAVRVMPGHLLGVGVAIPGSVDSRASGVVDAPTLGWTDAQVGATLRSRLDLPVLVENDVNAVAVADRLYGAGRDYDSYLVVTIGRGVGSAIVMDGIVRRGASGGAGEIGHVTIDPAGPVCDCGSRGCVEALIGDAALVRKGREAGVLTGRQGSSDLLAAARAGNDAARRVYADAGDILGRALSGAVQLLDPQMVVLLGEGTDAWPLWVSGFETSFRSGLMAARRSVPLLVESWSDYQWALGAAALVLSAPFDASGVGGEQGRWVRARLQTAPSEHGSVTAAPTR